MAEGAEGERRRRWPKRVAIGAGVLLALLIAGTITAGWYFANLLITPDHKPGPYDEEVVSSEPGRVTLKRTADSARPGVYGLDWPHGHAIAGRVLADRDGKVTRELNELRGRLTPRTKVEIENNVYEGNPRGALRIPFRRIGVPTKLGPMPAWQIDGRGSTWAIYVHGYQASRANGLRDLPVLHRAGLPTLMVSYRNDAGAPKGPGGKIHLGATEWLDLQSAADYAVAHGARRFVLLGDSMGGGIVCDFVRNSRLSPRVRSLVLDAPALSWKPILALNADELGVPFFVTDTAEFFVKQRVDISWSEIDQLDHTSAFKVPILLFHGTADRTVPIATSNEFAHRLPRLVSYTRVRDASHVGSWNVDPAAYERKLAAFLSRTPAPPAR